MIKSAHKPFLPMPSACFCEMCRNGWVVPIILHPSHLDHLQNPVLIRDDRIKWLDFGATPDPENLQPHPGFVWVKSGYSKTIVWCKIRLTQQRNIDLTTDGLWAMPFNTGGSQSRRAGWRIGKNWRNMFQFTSRGMCAPMGSLPLWKGATMRRIRIHTNQWSLKHCPILCIIHFAAPFAKKCDHLPPPPPT